MALHRFAMAYDSVLRRRPITVKALTSGVINATADFAIQSATRPEGQPIDLRRTAMYGGIYGMCWYGPFMHTVTTTWGRVMPSTSVPSLAFKTAVDMCTSLPFNLACVIGLQAYIRGEDPVDTVRRNHWSSWTTAMMVWPPAIMMVYRVEPVYRVLCLNSCSFFWNCGMITFFCSTKAAPVEAPTATIQRAVTGHTSSFPAREAIGARNVA